MIYLKDQLVVELKIKWISLVNNNNKPQKVNLL